MRVFFLDIAEGLSEEFVYLGATINYTTSFGVITSATSVLNRYTADYEDASEFTAAAFGTPLLPSPISLLNSTHIAAEELRFASTWHAPVQFVGGLWYDKTDTTAKQFQPIQGFLPIFGTTIAEALYQPQAVELTYAMTSKWSATIGGRYSKDETITGG
jgi:outer membrane receptor protein involved in Fe transport